MQPIFFLDLDTQKDFLYADGSCSISGGERVLPVLSKLTQFAHERQLPIISTICVHDEGDNTFHDLAAHCRRGKDGAHKVPESLLLKHHTIENQLLDRNMAVLFDKYEQLVLEKQDFGLFANPNASRLLSCLGRNVFVYGCHEESLQRSVQGLLERRLQVALVEDACVFRQPAAAKRALAPLEAKGARRITSRQLFATLAD